MKKTIIIGFAILFLTSFAARAAGAKEVSVNLNDMLTTITYYYDQNKLTGDIYSSLRGLRKGEPVITVTNAAGKEFFRRKYKCEENVYSESGPQCNLSPIDGEQATNATMVDGEYTLRVLVAGEEVYALNFNLVVTKDFNMICVYGDWSEMASIDLAASPGVNISFFMGDPKATSESMAVEAHLYRDGVFVGRGHVNGFYYMGCSTTSNSFMLFKDTPERFTEWITRDMILENPGEYEMKLFANRKLDKTFKFTVTQDGQVVPNQPRKMQAGLRPESNFTYPGTSWLYAE